MQSEAITTLTARYDLREDRIALDCLLHDQNQLIIFLTQRFANAVVLELTKLVSKSENSELIHEFTQVNAVSNKTSSDPVEISGDQNPCWLATHMHIQLVDDVHRLIFTEDNREGVHLHCDEHMLRNVLDILHNAFSKAQWDHSAFPAWIRVNENEDGLVHKATEWH